MSVFSLRVALGGVSARVSDRALGGVFLLIGAVLVYLVLFDQGAALSALVAGSGNLLHEFFHDGRHLWNAPCH